MAQTAANSLKPSFAAIRDRVNAPGSFEVRIATVLVALLILYIRMPYNFTNPQFWGEDGAIFFKYTEEVGLRSFLITTAGYYLTHPWLVALAAKLVSPAWAPWIYNYAGVAIALLAVYLATSPRFDMPLRPLLALAIVTVPQGYETLGALANGMWILPVITFILLFSAPASRTVLAGEALFLAIQGLSGPFSLFFLPLYVIRLAMVRHDREAYRRLLLLTIVVAAAALVQAISLYLHRDTGAFQAPFTAAYPWQLWITLPVFQVFRSFGSSISTLFLGNLGIVATLAMLSLAFIAAIREPYRPQKLMMAALGLIIALSGMLKYRYSLNTTGEDRYFYVAGIFGLWFIGCVAQRGIARYAVAAIILTAEIISIFKTTDTPRQREDFEWAVWASYLSSGIPVRTIPIAPSWAMDMAASPGGPLATFATWPGKTLAELGQQRTDPSACTGAFESLEPDIYHHSGNLSAQGTRAIAGGWAWNSSANRPVRLIVMTDSSDRVVGLGLPGFKKGANAAGPFPRSGWIATIAKNPAMVVRAYAVLDDGQGLCPLQNTRSVRQVLADFTTGAFAEGLALKPGTKVVQRLGVSANRLSLISFRTVNWGKVLSPYVIQWRVLSVAGDSRRVIASGELLSKGRIDWQPTRLTIEPTNDGASGEIEIEFFAPPNQEVTAPLGLPLNRLGPDNRAPPVQIDGQPHPGNLVVAVTAEAGG
jgi:hypothetical protein